MSDKIAFIYNLIIYKNIITLYYFFFVQQLYITFKHASFQNLRWALNVGPALLICYVQFLVLRFSSTP